MTEADLYLVSLTSTASSNEYVSDAEALLRRRVLSLEVELLEVRLQLGRLVYVRYAGVGEPDSDEDLRRDG